MWRTIAPITGFLTSCAEHSEKKWVSTCKHRLGSTDADEIVKVVWRASWLGSRLERKGYRLRLSLVTLVSHNQ